jgi:hypothetical protein
VLGQEELIPMSVDTTFHPLTETIVVDSTAAAQIKQGAMRGTTTFRIAARGAAPGVVYVAYGIAAPAAPTAPAAVGTLLNTIGIAIGTVCYVELPGNSFFIASAAFTTSFVEITGGIGGVGG